MSKFIFVVMENNFEYNDEYYYATGGGTPVKAFADRVEADQHAEARMKNFLETADEHLASSYFDGTQEANWEECQKAAAGGIEERLKFAKEINLNLFEVVGVAVEPTAELEDSADFEFEQ